MADLKLDDMVNQLERPLVVSSAGTTGGVRGTLRCPGVEPCWTVGAFTIERVTRITATAYWHSAGVWGFCTGLRWRRRIDAFSTI